MLLQFLSYYVRRDWPTSSRNNKAELKPLLSLGGLGVFLAILLIIGIAQPLQAQKSRDQAHFNPLFKVENLLVRSHGDGSAAARRRAFELAHIAGLREVVSRVSVHEARQSLRLPSLDELTSMVETIWVKDQRLSQSKLIALMDMQFSQDAVEAYLQREGVTFSANKANPVLVLPILNTQGQAYGWGRENPWFRIWSQNPMPESLVSFILPEEQAQFQRLQELAEAATLFEQSQPQTFGLSAAVPTENFALITLEKELRKVSAGGLLLLALWPLIEDGVVTSLEVKARPFGSIQDLIGQGQLTPSTVNELGFAQSLELRLDESEREDALRFFRQDMIVGEDLDASLHALAKSVVQAYNQAWKDKTSVSGSRLSQMVMEVALQDLGQWIALEETLNRIASVERVDLQALNEESALIALSFSGDVDQLSLLLAQDGYDLVPSIDRYFLVKKP